MVWVSFFFFSCQFSESSFYSEWHSDAVNYNIISLVWAHCILRILRVLCLFLQVGTYTNQSLLPLLPWLTSVPCTESVYVETVVHCNFSRKGSSLGQWHLFSASLGQWHWFSAFIATYSYSKRIKWNLMQKLKFPICMDPNHFDPDFKLRLSYKAHSDFMYRRLQNAVIY